MALEFSHPLVGTQAFDDLITVIGPKGETVKGSDGTDVVLGRQLFIHRADGSAGDAVLSCQCPRRGQAKSGGQAPADDAIAQSSEQPRLQQDTGRAVRKDQSVRRLKRFLACNWHNETPAEWLYPLDHACCTIRIADPTEGTLMTSTLQQLLLDHVQAGNAHDMHATLATLHPECVFEDTATGQVFNGREGAARHYRQWWDAFNLDFSRGKQGSGRWTADGSYVAEGVYSGHHVGPFLG